MYLLRSEDFQSDREHCIRVCSFTQIFTITSLALSIASALHICQCAAVVHGVHSSPVHSQWGDASTAETAAQDAELAATVRRVVVEGQPLGLTRWEKTPPVGDKLHLLYEIAGVVLPRHLNYGLAVKESHGHSVDVAGANDRRPGETILQLKPT